MFTENRIFFFLGGGGGGIYLKRKEFSIRGVVTSYVTEIIFLSSLNAGLLHGGKRFLRTSEVFWDTHLGPNHVLTVVTTCVTAGVMSKK